LDLTNADGVTVNVQKDFNQKYDVRPPLPTAKVTLNGAQALGT